MAYEYEKENKEAVMINPPKANKELQEVYRKAKAFDEILNITQLQHEEEYAEDVISVIDKYKEDE
ncbi:hypothetical protein [Staphylococcus cohnii]